MATTGKRAAQAASRVMRSKGASRDAKRAAASALRQVRRRRRK